MRILQAPLSAAFHPRASPPLFSNANSVLRLCALCVKSQSFLATRHSPLSTDTPHPPFESLHAHQIPRQTPCPSAPKSLQPFFLVPPAVAPIRRAGPPLALPDSPAGPEAAAFCS